MINRMINCNICPHIINNLYASLACVYPYNFNIKRTKLHEYDFVSIDQRTYFRPKLYMMKLQNTIIYLVNLHTTTKTQVTFDYF